MKTKPTGKKVQDKHGYIFYKEHIKPYLNTSETLQEELQNAFFDNDWSLMRHLLVQGAFINYRYGSDGKTLLFYCNSVDKIRELVDMGADVNAKNSNGESLIGYSIRVQWSVDAVRLLLKYGANVNVQGPYGKSPLGLALCHKNLELIKLMMEYKANINGTDKYCTYTPIMDAIDKLICAKILVKYGVLNGEEDDCKKGFELERQKRERQKLSEPPYLSEVLNYLKACVAEVALMKQEFIHENYSLCDYLNRSQNCILQFDSTIYLEKFPIYADIIQETIHKVTQRKQLLKELNVITVQTRSGQETISLNYDVTLEIAQYLDDDTLENLISAFEIEIKNF